MANSQKPVSQNLIDMVNDIILLYTTFPDQNTADEICRQLAEERLIACANIFSPMTSHYWWKDQLEKSSEIPAILKSKKRLFPQIESRLKALHPYEVPCLIELPTDRVSQDYERWLLSQLS